MSELKRCPFCGGEGEVVGGNPYHWVFCKNCDAETKQSATIEGAIRIWNTRKPMEKILERLEGKSFRTESTFDDDGYCNDDSEEVVLLSDAIKIIKEEGEA